MQTADLKIPELHLSQATQIHAKKHLEQIRIIKEVLYSRNHDTDIKKLVKGFIIESYIEDGAQKVGENVYGKSIADPCLSWEKNEKLIFDIAEAL